MVDPFTSSNIDDELRKVESELVNLETKRNELHDRRCFLKREKARLSSSNCRNEMVEKDKVALFRALFRGREDVFPRRFESKKTGKSGYQPACANEWIKGICGKPKTKCLDCLGRQFVPVTDQVIRSHLLGRDNFGRDFTMGVYPLLEDETCWFLAVDFDKLSWEVDVKAFLEACASKKVPAVCERSRSGNGGHVWVFFSEPVSACVARRMGSFLLTETMENRPELGFDSYDRFFPNQDTMPKGGFGNLIALPLQAKPRQNGNSVFIDQNFAPYPDQWKFLSNIHKMALKEVEEIAENAVRNGRVTGVRMVVEDEDDPPWEQPPSRRKKKIPITGVMPEKLDIVLENQIYIEKEKLPAQLKTRLIRTAAFQNPEFYKAQAMRMPVYNKPRIISCCEEFSKYIGLPRGCADDVTDLLVSLKIRCNVIDKRIKGRHQNFIFQGKLREEQEKAVLTLTPYDIGVLSASTAFGKTVVAAYMIAKRNVNTLILVHRLQLVEQWRARLENFLGIPYKKIGIIGGGKRNTTGIIDIATIQSLCKKGVVDDSVGEYGHIVVDECHHLSAVSFENVARQCKARFFLGLSATLTRKDGHHPIIFMQCGPVRYKVDDRKQARERPFQHQVVIRDTKLKLPDHLQDEDVTIHDIYELLMTDEKRNDMMVDDIVKAIKMRRSPVVITERKEHLKILYERLEPKVRNIIVLKGGMSKKERQAAFMKLSQIPENKTRLILATGRYLGEGFDDDRLDTLFLTMPISWRGTLSQYAGRLHRLHHMKRQVRIYDYADKDIPMTHRMFKRRCVGYKAIGYDVSDNEYHQPELLNELAT